MKEKMSEYGYTESNLFSKENRTPIKIRRMFYETTNPGNGYWEEIQDPPKAFITNALAEKMPDELFLATAFDDSRVVYQSEEDLIQERNAIFGTVGPEKAHIDIPHLLFEPEIKN